MTRGEKVQKLKNRSRITEDTKRLGTLYIDRIKIIFLYTIRKAGPATNNIRQDVTVQPKSNIQNSCFRMTSQLLQQRLCQVFVWQLPAAGKYYYALRPNAQHNTLL